MGGRNSDGNLQSDETGIAQARLVADRILSVGGFHGGERKLATCLVTEAIGFETVCSKMAPGEAYALANKLLSEIESVLIKLGGTVGQVADQQVLAFFGAPWSHEDHPARACAAALEIMSSIAALRSETQSQGVDPIMARIGVNTGPVLVGSVRQDLGPDYFSVGDTGGEAYRIKDMAGPGDILVSIDTVMLCEGFFDFRPKSPQEAPVSENGMVRKLIGPTALSRFGVRAAKGLTTFVGRRRELGRIEDSFERSCEGAGAAVAVVGEAGLGKSRLVYEFKRLLRERPVRYVEGRCPSLSGGAPFYPWIEILKASLDIVGTEGPEEISRKVEEGLNEAGLRDPEISRVVFETLWESSKNWPNPTDSPYSVENSIKRALETLLVQWSLHSPLVIAIEDIHWADNSTNEFIEHFLKRLPLRRIFMLLTYRPDVEPSFQADPRCERITLDPLSEESTTDMIRDLLRGRLVDRRVSEHVALRSSGNPLFIEEFIRSIPDGGGSCEPDLHHMSWTGPDCPPIPSTISDLIAARIDRLPDMAKGVLQIAAVIAKEFSYQLLLRIVQVTEKELLVGIYHLKNSGLIVEMDVQPQALYAVKHDLVREVIYNSIATAAKSSLHRRVAHAMEEIYGDNISEHAGFLVEHCLRCGDSYRVAKYAGMAARRARKTASFAQAIEYTDILAASLERMHQTEEVEDQLIDARTKLGLYLMQINDHVGAKKAVSPVLESAITRKSNRRLAQIYAVLGTYSCFAEEAFEQGMKELEQATDLSRSVSDTFSLVTAWVWTGMAHSACGRFSEAKEYFEKARAINAAAGVQWGVSMVNSLISSLALNFLGEVDLSIDVASEALEDAEKSGDRLSRAMAQCSLGMATYHKGRMAPAHELLSEAAELLSNVQYYYWYAWTYFFLGLTSLRLEGCDAALEMHRKSVDALESRGIMRSCVILNEAAVAYAKASNGAGTVSLKRLSARYEQNRFQALSGWIARLNAKTALCLEPYPFPHAETWLREAINANAANGMKLHLGKDHELYAALCLKREDWSGHEEHLLIAQEVFSECGWEGEPLAIGVNNPLYTREGRAWRSGLQNGRQKTHG